MIHLTRLNGEDFVLNAEVIREIESTPDTVITLVNREKIIVLETVEEICKAVIKYKRAIMTGEAFEGKA